MKVGKDAKKPAERAARACLNCRRRKVKCSGQSPCVNCRNYGCACTYAVGEAQPQQEHCFNHPRDVTRMIGRMEKSLEGLDELLRDSSESCAVLGEMSAKIEHLKSLLDTGVNAKWVAAYQGEKSMEHEITYRNRSLFRRDQPLISKLKSAAGTTYELYSPIMSLSVKGVSSMMHKLLSYADNEAARETFYLFLKSFDAANSFYLTSAAFWSVPLSTNFNQFSSAPARGITSLRQLVSQIPADLWPSPQAREQVDLANATQACCELVRVLQTHHRVNGDLPFDNGNPRSFVRFVDMDQLVTTACAELLTRSTLSESLSLEYVDALLSFLECKIALETPDRLCKIAAIVVRMLIDLGLDRWEYYVSVDEHIANRRRKLWWRAYWWDRFLSCYSGRAPQINDAHVTCLFPREVMALGIDDSMDHTAILDHIPKSGADLEAVMLVACLAAGKHTSYMFTNVLHARRFTHYKLHSDISVTASGLIEELIVEIDGMLRFQTRLEAQLSPYREALTAHPIYQPVLPHLACVFLCLLLAVENLARRVREVAAATRPLPAAKSLARCRSQTLYIARVQLTDVAHCKTLRQFLADKLTASVAFLVAVDHFIHGEPDATDPTLLALICSFAHQLTRFSVTHKSEGDETPHTELRYPSSVLLVLARICLQIHNARHSPSAADALNSALAKALPATTVPDVRATAAELLTVTSRIWRPVLSCKEVSAYHGAILRHLDTGDPAVAETARSAESRFAYENSVEHHTGATTADVGDGPTDRSHVQQPAALDAQLLELEALLDFSRLPDLASVLCDYVCDSEISADL
ncbi:LAQU0S05e06546g1_1 [Lachancea quebecensis]|uniref:LAQU0S05e06546g1_1 n=1 Tax=Lachancea quebecensis TaxID=1654605 RepID=A0A0P1KRT5_9SACH|nr:LAQU0S05e06546g1_1 [Lachancea quebecensis]